jgi:hypothetical protein
MHYRQRFISFWVLSKVIPHFVEKLLPFQETKVLEEIIINIQNKDWSLAKQNLYTKIKK